MRKVWKYRIHPNSFRDGQYVVAFDAPKGATVLCVMKQNSDICAWVEVNTDEPEQETVKIICVGTGHGAVPEGALYIGSVVDGDCVWHFYV